MAYRVRGQVAKIFPHNEGCFIELKDIDHRPRDDYFLLNISHSNYNALYSLALVAAVNRYVLEIRTAEDITPDEHAQVNYMRLMW